MDIISEILKILDKRKYHKVFLFLITITMIFLGISVAMLDLMKIYDKNIVDLSIVSVVSVIVILSLSIVFRVILSYLDGKNDDRLILGKDIIHSALGYDTTLDEESKEELITKIKEKIQKEAVDDYIDELRISLKSNECIEYSKFQSAQTLARIREAISAQNAKANFNLVLGMITAIVGVGFLIFFIPNYNIENFDLPKFLITFLPRLSVVILIETFAYFFLKMYRFNLNEIKYFQNEATSIENRLQSLNIAIQLDERETIKTILLSFSNTDRNQKELPIVTENMPFSLDYLVKVAEIIKDKKE